MQFDLQVLLQNLITVKVSIKLLIIYFMSKDTAKSVRNIVAQFPVPK